jgi:hypothetical protein
VRTGCQTRTPVRKLRAIENVHYSSEVGVIGLDHVTRLARKVSEGGDDYAGEQVATHFFDFVSNLKSKGFV